MAEPKIKVDNLTVSFRTNQGFVRAVRGVDFEVAEGETLAIVGESGSGKSVTSRTIMGILAGNGVIDDGQIIYENQDLTKIHEEDFHRLRGNKIGMIFQDPMSSLNPIMKIGKQITEGMLVNGKRLKNREKAIIHKIRMRYLNAKNERRHDIEKFKLKRKELKAEGKTEELAELTQAHKEKMVEYKERIAKAKIELRPAHRDAHKQVMQEWNAEKARVKEEIANVKVKLDGASPEQKKDIKKEIEDLKEGLRRYKKVTRREATERALKVMDEVGIPEPKKRLKQYPFQFSGGMRQRIVIAIALTADPDILICDEPTTALDVTIQAQILELIKKLKEERGLTVIFITHDLGVVANMADRIAVMYAGKIVEIGTSEEIFYSPKHPYTWALLSSMPDLESKERLFAIPGTPPNMLFPPKGDAFADRNPYALKIDFEEEPPFFKVSDTHYAATWLQHKNAPSFELPDIVRGRIKRMTEGRDARNEVSK